MNIDKDIAELERITILKTEIVRIDLNFLDKENLEEIEEIAYDLEIEEYLTEFNIEDLYNSEYDKLCTIYKQWYNDILNAFENINNKINKRLNEN